MLNSVRDYSRTICHIQETKITLKFNILHYQIYLRRELLDYSFYLVLRDVLTLVFNWILFIYQFEVSCFKGLCYLLSVNV